MSSSSIRGWGFGLALFLSAAGAQTPGPPTYTSIGSLYCGARTYSATQIQLWCQVVTDWSSYPYNTLASMPASGYATAGYSWVEPDTTDSSGSVTHHVSTILWLISQSGAASQPNYQITSGTCSGTDLPFVCTQVATVASGAVVDAVIAVLWLVRMP
jgi:hypothetical protein